MILFPDFEQIYLFGLLLGRAGGLVAMAPFFGERLVPRKLRILLVAALAFLMIPLVTNPPTMPADFGVVVTALIGEMAVGVAMGFLGRLLILAFSMAGEVISFQMGFAMAALVDPMQPHRQTVMGRWMWLTAMTLFLALGGHHVLLRALCLTLDTLPPGGGFLSDGSIAALARFTADTFVSGMQMAAPAVGILLLTSTALGILARSVPQMNVFIVGFPLKITAGILGLIWALPYLVDVARRDIAELVHNDFPFSLRPPRRPSCPIAQPDRKGPNPPLPRRRGKARAKGQVAKSTEISAVVVFSVGLAALGRTRAAHGGARHPACCGIISRTSPSSPCRRTSVLPIAQTIAASMAAIVLPLAGLIRLRRRVAANVAQTGFLLTATPLQPKFNRINPATGVKRIISKRGTDGAVQVTGEDRGRRRRGHLDRTAGPPRPSPS